MSRVDVTLGGNNAGFKKMLEQSRGEAKKFGSGISQALNLGNAMSAANLGAGLVSGVQQLVGTVLNEFEKIQKISIRVDMDPGQVQKYGMAAKNAGADIDKLNDAWSDQVKNVAAAQAGDEGMIKSLKTLGVEAKELAGLGVEEVFLKLAEGYKNATDKGQAYHAIQAVLGEASREMIPLLQLGADGIRKVVGEMSGADAEDFAAIENLNKQLANMQNELTTAAGETLPVFFATMKTGWNAISMILRVVSAAIHRTVGAVMPFFSSSLSWSEKFALSIQNIKDSNQMMIDGIKEDAADIEKAWSDVDGGPEKKNDEDAGREAAANNRINQIARERSEREKLAILEGREREKTLKGDEQAAKAREDLSRKIVKKKAELAIAEKRASGNNSEAEKLEKQLKLWEAVNTYQSELNLSKSKGLLLAQKELSLEEKITAMKQAQQDLLDKKRSQAAATESERDGLLRLADGLSGGVDSLQSIGLGVSGARYGESKEVVKLREMAVQRNVLLKDINENIKNLEIEIQDAEF